MESRSHSYVRDPAHCEFLLTSFDSPWGVVENPRHSLPPNTTCRYHFQGRRREIVWLAFLKYHASSADAAPYEGQECGVRLRVWDGRLAAPGQPAPMQVSITIPTRAGQFTATVCLLFWCNQMKFEFQIFRFRHHQSMKMFHCYIITSLLINQTRIINSNINGNFRE